MPNIYKHKNKLNQIALKKQKEFPNPLTCIKPLYSKEVPDYISLNVDEQVNLTRIPTSFSSENLYTFGFVSNADKTNVDMFMLTEQEVEEHFDMTEIKNRGLSISDAPIEKEIQIDLKKYKNIF